MNTSLGMSVMYKTASFMYNINHWNPSCMAVQATLPQWPTHHILRWNTSGSIQSEGHAESQHSVYLLIAAFKCYWS